MKKKKTLIQKLNVLIRKSRVPRFLHGFGPKKYTTWQHLKCLLLKELLKCSYRRLLPLLPYFGIKRTPERTTLIKFAKRFPTYIWNLLLKASSGLEECLYGAIDSTGLSRNNASSYYIKRIDRDVKTQRHMQLSVYVAVEERKFLSARVRAKPAHDSKDVKYLTSKSPALAEINLMDKAYDANWIHEFFRTQGVYSIIPVRKWSKTRGRYRKEMSEYFDYGQYWQRNIVETLIGCVKRVYGEVLYAKHIITQRAEVYSRLILYNISSFCLLKLADFFT